MTLALAVLLAGCTSTSASTTGTTQASPSPGSTESSMAGATGTATNSIAPATAAAVMKVVNDMKDQLHLRAVLVRVTRDGQENSQ